MDKTFLGKGWKFPPTFNKSRDSVELVEEEEDIEESLRIILSTAPGERVMEPEFGCDIHHHVFDTMNFTRVNHFKVDVKKAILMYEPRIDLLKVDVYINEDVDGRLDIYLEYEIRSTNSRSNMVYPFYVNEGTNLNFDMN
ncbi:MAG: GPW/gp25 family protein [Balneolaceae bacterium]|nr:GPW/gp25 family protein [Balneolaceae bacterium]